MDMTNVISVFAVLGLVFISAFFQLSSIIWTILIGVALLIMSVCAFLTPITFVVLWVLFLVAAAFANLTKLRQRYVVTPALKTLKKQLPTISDTERAAIEAGDTWWEKELFCGRPSWKKLEQIPRPTLSEEEQVFSIIRLNIFAQC